MRTRGGAAAAAAAVGSPAAGIGAKSLRDMAYEAIKHRITTCEFRPGQYLNEASVSASLGIGRTPVHQALDRLNVEGMVEVIARKGVIVKPLSLDEVLQIIEVRLLNETYSVRLAAERANAEEIAQLDDVLARAKDLLVGGSSEQMMQLDREFHLTLGRAARNAVLAAVLARLHDRALRFWIISLNAPGHYRDVYHEHCAILDAIRARAPDAAEAAMRQHIEAFRRNIVQFV
jgi:DNA-binding GntR family transcriptional regulator